MLKNSACKVVLEVFKKALQVFTKGEQVPQKEQYHFVEVTGKKWTVKIPPTEFTNNCKTLDLGKEQGRYDNVFPKGSKLRRGRVVDQDHDGRWIHTHIMDRGFASQSFKILHQESRYFDMRYPDKSKDSVWGHRK
jgi:hypothetical protein